MRRTIYASANSDLNGRATAVAGSNQSVEQVSAITNLDGTGSSTTGGTISTYQWKILSGTGLIIDSPTSPTSSISGTSVVGESLIQLTITDTNGNVDVDWLTIEIILGDPLTVTSTQPNASNQGTITFKNGQPNEVVDLGFILSNGNNPDSVSFASAGILFGALDYTIPTGVGQITLDANGDGSSTYTVVGQYFQVSVNITGRSSTYPLPNSNYATTSFSVYS